MGGAHIPDLRRWRGLLLVLLALAAPRPAGAFPGIFVASDGGMRVAQTAHVVLLRRAELSVVTVMVDHDGPVSPFAVALPVPPDVRAADVRSVKREFFDRLEELSAPRFHAFYEQDPCTPGEPEQEWERKVFAEGTGLLGTDIPPADQDSTVPPELGLSIDPVFKGSESEFSFTILTVSTKRALEAQLAARGLRASADQIRALLPYLEQGQHLLLARVDPDRVELVGGGRIQLGGIRYFTRTDASRLPVSLGALSTRRMQDLFVYVLHPESRYEARSHPNAFPPSNVRIDGLARERIAQLYNTIHDRLLARTPDLALTEFVWEATGCGEPCPNAPLEIRELLTLGGDEVEETAVSAAEQHPNPPALAPDERAELRRLLEATPAAQRAQRRHQLENDRRETWRRRALIARHRYVLTRLHWRFGEDLPPPRDVQLAPAEGHREGGIGIPQGLPPKLTTVTRAATQSRYQIRFIENHRWTRPTPCEKPQRGRWGRRWSFLDHQLRKIWLGRDLPAASRDPALAAQAIRTRLSPLSLGMPPPSRPPPPPPPSTPSGQSCGCRTGGSEAPSGTLLGWIAIAVGCFGAGRRKNG